MSWTDKPWIVVVNNIPCYAGYFITDASVGVFPYPEISALEAGTWGYPKDIITSDWIFWFFNQDIRNNDLVKNALIHSGLFRGGIQVSLDTSNLPIRVLNQDTTIVEYSLSIKNNDQDNIYIFDPYKMDNEIFHYYNNGPNFFDVNSQRSYGSLSMKTRKPEFWDSNWYYLLKSGEFITRTIKLKGYPYIPEGTYLIECGYSVPKQGLDKNKRETPQGRYWIGNTRTDTLRVKIEY